MPLSTPFEKIGEWTTDRLTRFVTQQIQQSHANLPPSITSEYLTASRKVTVADELELSPQALQYLKTQLQAIGMT